MKISIEARLLRLVEPNENGCLLFRHPKKRGPYVTYKGKCLSAYRLMYEYKIGPIPHDMTIDHLCFNRACLNTDHMEVVTQRENSLRWMAKFYRENPNYPCGHPRVPEQTVAYKNGSSYRIKRCKPCTQEQSRAYLKQWRLKNA